MFQAIRVAVQARGDEAIENLRLYVTNIQPIPPDDPGLALLGKQKPIFLRDPSKGQMPLTGVVFHSGSHMTAEVLRWKPGEPFCIGWKEQPAVLRVSEEARQHEYHFKSGNYALTVLATGSNIAPTRATVEVCIERAEPTVDPQWWGIPTPVLPRLRATLKRTRRRFTFMKRATLLVILGLLAGIVATHLWYGPFGLWTYSHEGMRRIHKVTGRIEFAYQSPLSGWRTPAEQQAMEERDAQAQEITRAFDEEPTTHDALRRLGMLPEQERAHALDLMEKTYRDLGQTLSDAGRLPAPQPATQPAPGVSIGRYVPTPLPPHEGSSDNGDGSH